MSEDFDHRVVEAHGWRQGAVLGPKVREAARELAPKTVAVTEDDWLIVTSHDCDVVNESLAKEPVIEVLRAVVVRRLDKQQSGGRNPRGMHLSVRQHSGEDVFLALKVHDRWTVPRGLLMQEATEQIVPIKERRAIAEWLAKRYIRAAFPNAFDKRWGSQRREWVKILERHSTSIQGVYLRLNTTDELSDGSPYKVDILVASPTARRHESDWQTVRDEIENDVAGFWTQFAGIEFIEVDVLGTDEVTLDHLERYQRFDADWVSFADDSPTTAIATDLRS